MNTITYKEVNGETRVYLEGKRVGTILCAVLGGYAYFPKGYKKGDSVTFYPSIFQVKQSLENDIEDKNFMKDVETKLNPALNDFAKNAWENHPNNPKNKLI